MNSKILVKSILFFLFLMHIIILPQEKKANVAISSNQLVIPRFAKFNCNNISTFIYNNGFADFDNSMQESGFIYPKGTNKYY